MPLSYVKETVEIESFETDAFGEALITRRINLKEGYKRQLAQVDIFEDAIPFTVNGEEAIQIVVSAYPSVPTSMRFSSQPPAYGSRLVSAGDDSVLFKAVGKTGIPSTWQHTGFRQFPSPEIAAGNFTEFYSDHVYITIKWDGDANTVYGNIGLSFLFVFKESKVSYLTGTIGKLAEQHNAMCALVMSTGTMTSITTLRGNTFPMWRFGGIRPEHTISPTAANSYFLEISTRDAEDMVNTTQIRQSVGDARRMSAYDEAFGERRPDWLRMNLNQGIVAGPVRPNPVPLIVDTNGIKRMF